MDIRNIVFVCLLLASGTVHSEEMIIKGHYFFAPESESIKLCNTNTYWWWMAENNEIYLKMRNSFLNDKQSHKKGKYIEISGEIVDRKICSEFAWDFEKCIKVNNIIQLGVATPNVCK